MVVAEVPRGYHYSPTQRIRKPIEYDPRYPYIHVSSTEPYIINRRLTDEAALTFHNDLRFSEKYTNDFINSQLQDEIIPDILIEVLDEMTGEVSQQFHVSIYKTIFQSFSFHIFCIRQILRSKWKLL